jgi:hypothetical protein
LRNKMFSSSLPRATVFKTWRPHRRIYFGTDYDDQRNGEVLKIASYNHMQIIQGG